MKIKIITLYDNEYKDMFDIMNYRYKEYCKIHNYDYEPYYIENKNLIKNINNSIIPLSWYKIKLLSDNLKLNYDYVMWVDCDTILYNYDITIESIIDNSNKDIFFSIPTDHINCGVFIIKNTQSVKDFLNCVYTYTNIPNYLYHGWWEQNVIHKLIRENYNNINDKIEIIDATIINALDFSLYKNEKQNCIIDKDKTLIIHFPGLKKDIRINEMKKI